MVLGPRALMNVKEGLAILLKTLIRSSSSLSYL